MSTNMTTPAATVTTKPTKPARNTAGTPGPKSFGIRPAGEQSLWCRAYRTRTGWRSEAVLRAGKKNSRGASQEHTTLDLAKGAVAQLVAAAERQGWRKREPRGSFTRKADAFGLAKLPKPAAPAKPVKK